MVYIDIDKEILYWIEQYGFKPKNTGKLIDYIKRNWVKDQIDIIKEFVEVMEIKVPSIDILDWNKIAESDDDYELLGNSKYLNIYALEANEMELRRLNLIE